MPAPKVDEGEDDHSAMYTRLRFVPERGDGRPCKAGDLEAEAEESVVDEKLGWEGYEQKGIWRWTSGLVSAPW